MLKELINLIKCWWKRNIIDECPPNLEDEFSDKYRK